MGELRLLAYQLIEDLRNDDHFIKYDMPQKSRFLIDDIEQVIIENLGFGWRDKDLYSYSITSMK